MRGIVGGLDLIARGCIPVATLGERIESQYDLAVGLLIATAIVLALSASGS